MRCSVNPAATQVGQNLGKIGVLSTLGDIPRPNRSSRCVEINTTIDPVDWMRFRTFFPSHHHVAMSAAGHADAGNVTQDDANDDYDDGLDNGH